MKPAAIYQPHTKQLYFLIMLLQVLNAIVKQKDETLRGQEKVTYFSLMHESQMKNMYQFLKNANLSGPHDSAFGGGKCCVYICAFKGKAAVSLV